MAITSSAPNGIQITTSAKSGTVKSFTGGKARLEDPITTGNNGNLMASPVYTGRIIELDGGTGSGQVRLITGQTTALGDGDDVDLDVFPDWDTNPDGTSTFQISYIIEDVGTVTGAASAPRAQTGVWEGYGRELYVGSGGGTYALFFTPGEVAFEYRDNGSTTQGDVTVRDGGVYQAGFFAAETGLAGGLNFGINNTDNELVLDLLTGSITRFYDVAFWCLVANLTITVDGGTHTWDGVKMFGCAYNTLLNGVTVDNHIFEGKGTSNDWVRIEDNCTINSCIMTNTAGWTSLDDGLTETLEVRNCIFVRTVTTNVTVHDDKTWNFVNPVNWAGDGTAIAFQVDDLNEVNKLFSLAISVTEPDGTAIVDADCYVYEGTLNQDLPTANRVDTDSNGEASTDVLVEKYTFPASSFTTATSGAHALKIYEWLKTPFVGSLTPDFTVTGGLTVGVVLNDNPNIVQTTQATAITAGSGITIEQPTNPTTLLSYDTGTIAFNVGDVVTGATSGAVGTVTEVTEGDTTSGRIHLRVRNGTAFSNAEDLEVSATKNAQTLASSVALDFQTHIDGNGLSLQTIHDYWAARQAEDAISSDGITSIEWGAGEYAQIVFATGSAFLTERNVGNTDGVFISDYGAGAVSYMTADDGTQYVPPTTVTLTVTCRFNGAAREGIRVRIETTGGTLISEGSTNASGVFTDSYTYTGDVAVNVVVRQKAFIFQSIATTIEATGLTQGVALVANKAVNLP